MKIEPKSEELENEFKIFNMDDNIKELKQRHNIDENVEGGPESHENARTSDSYKRDIGNQKENSEENLKIEKVCADSVHSLRYFKKEKSIDIEDNFDEGSNDEEEEIIKPDDNSKLKEKPQNSDDVLIQKNTKGKPYECSFCEKSFLNSADLKRHKRTHTGERPFTCSYCSKTFSDYSNHLAHVRTHGIEKTFTCSDCEKSFLTSSRLKEHQRMHTGERPFVCRYCSKTYVRGSNLRVHVRSHMKEKPYACSDCQKSFTTSTDLKRHKRIHTEERRYECQHCSKNFKSNSILQNHIRKHAKKIEALNSKPDAPEVTRKDGGTFKIETDDADQTEVALTSGDLQIKIEPKNDDQLKNSQFPSTEEVKKTRLEAGDKVECSPEVQEIVGIHSSDDSDTVRKKESSKEYIKTEPLGAISGEIGSEIIYECRDYFKREKSLEIEEDDEEEFMDDVQKIANTEDSSESEECSKTGEVMIGGSIQTYTKKKTFACCYCKKSFITSGDLKRHERTHTGERPYACNYCFRTFSDYSNHRAHMRTHMKEKPYVCSECGKSFVTSTNLKSHKWTHTQERPYACHYCSKTFSDSSNRRRHVRTHMKEERIHSESAGS